MVGRKWISEQRQNTTINRDCFSLSAASSNLAWTSRYAEGKVTGNAFTFSRNPTWGFFLAASHPSTTNKYTTLINNKTEVRQTEYEGRERGGEKKKKQPRRRWVARREGRGRAALQKLAQVCSSQWHVRSHTCSLTIQYKACSCRRR